MRLLAAIHPPDATQAILECLDLPARAPPATAPLPDDAALAPSWEADFEAGSDRSARDANPHRTLGGTPSREAGTRGMTWAPGTTFARFGPVRSAPGRERPAAGARRLNPPPTVPVSPRSPEDLP